MSKGFRVFPGFSGVSRGIAKGNIGKESVDMVDMVIDDYHDGGRYHMETSPWNQSKSILGIFTRGIFRTLLNI